jgi:voltage-gated potassium channel
MIPPVHIPEVMEEATQDADVGSTTLLMNWQYLPSQQSTRTGSKVYTLEEAEEAIEAMSQHFIICGSGPVMQRSTSKLDPDRPFVILSNDDKLVEELLGRGFRVIKGDAAHEEVLLKAGTDRALAIMVTVEDDADAVLTILNSRTLSKKLLITATASSDDMIPKLRRAGADRVISPFRIAAQFVLQATTRPAVSDFMQHVLFNYQTGLETTELYMQDNSPWIGKTIGELLLERLFRAGVIGVRRANGRFIYAPPDSHVIGEHEVLIITTPMVNSDELRLIAHGGESKRPETLRRDDEVRASQWF